MPSAAHAHEPHDHHATRARLRRWPLLRAPSSVAPPPCTRRSTPSDRLPTSQVIGPTPNAAFFASYDGAYLRGKAASFGLVAGASSSSATTDTVSALVDAASSAEARGYLLELAAYLQTAATGPRRCVGQRTGLYGLQRPPLDGKLTALRCGEATTLDELLPFCLVFAMTNAAPQALISVEPANDHLLDELPRLQLKAPRLAELALMLHNETQFAEPAFQATLTRTVRPSELAAVHRFPLAQPFVTRLMPPGHIKSARSDDAPFYAAIEPSAKWLKVVPDGA